MSTNPAHEFAFPTREALGAATGRELALPRAAFELRDEREAWAILHELAGGAGKVAWRDELGRSGDAHVLSNDGQLFLSPLDAGPGPAQSAHLTFSLHGVPLRVECALTDQRIVQPLRVISCEQRASTRAAPLADAHLEWFSSEDQGFHPRRAALVDVGSAGACALALDGAGLPEARVFAATVCVGSRRTHAMVSVQSRRRTARGEEVGLRFVHGERADIADFVMGTLFPKLAPRRAIPGDAMLELFEKSGYLKLRDSCRPSAAWLGLDADGLSRDLVYLAESGQPVGHSSITRAYRRCWLAHQTAMLSVHTDAVEARAQLLLGLTMLATLLDGSDAHVIAYYDRAKPYGRIFFSEFADSVASDEVAAVTSFDRFERAEAEPDRDFDPPPNATVDFAHESELALITTLVRAHVPPLYADASDIEPALLRRGALHPGYVGSDLERGREVLVLRVDGKLAGAALCEYTTRDLSLFNTMNLAQVYLPVRGLSGAAERLLQQRVRAFYAARGIADPVLVCPPGNFRATLDPHVTLAETMGAITWSFEGLRAYENYLRLRFAWMRQGRRPRPRARRPSTSVSTPDLESSAHDQRLRTVRS